MIRGSVEFLRDLYATAALPAVIETVVPFEKEEHTADWIADATFLIADAMLNRRARLPYVTDPGPPTWAYDGSEGENHEA